MPNSGRLAYATVPLVPIFAICGLWLLITGQPEAVQRGETIHIWKRIGLGLCLATGVVLGVAADARLLFGV